jgi:type II restriction/modification system DNA methylase subunit YeeA
MDLPKVDVDAVVTCIREAVKRSQNEEEVRLRVSNCIEERILKPLGISQVGRYEYTLVSGARADALYGHVIIEYKAPGKLASQSDIQKAREQVIKYITQEAGNKSEYGRYLGVIISDKIAFVRYDPRADSWLLRGPYEIRRESVIKLVEAIRGLRKKPLDVEHLLNDFGPKSEITVKLVRNFYSKATGLKDDSRGKLLFNDWLRLFRQATGYSPEDLKELSELVSEYKIPGKVDYNLLMFSIHTYYALLLKLIAAELAYLYGGGKFYRSYVAELDHKYSENGLEGIRSVLHDLESGGVFSKLLNIENFLEGDYFSWYLEVLDGELADMIAELARKLGEYEVATPQLEPEFARDLLKRLYQNLVPEDIRHKLGEYYTPDWLASYILDEIGLSFEEISKLGEKDTLKPLEIRVLDPACGSGTFLVLYISRLRRYAEEHYATDILLSYVLNNVVGYDLNPLAVLTARTNYLLAIADLLSYVSGSVELPIYLADSIIVEKLKPEQAMIAGHTYQLRTSAGEFEVPASIVEKGLLPAILSEIRRCLEGKYSNADFRKRLEHAYQLDPDDVETLVVLYTKLLKLEEEGRNRVWVGIIRNAFAPVLKGKFDFVVGNPPWVNWENLPESYRDLSRILWDRYGLTKIQGKKGLGKVKRDLAMLFLVRCFDMYLKEGGKLGFLMPFTVFKTQAGAGFREFLARQTKVHVIHDMVTLYPFEGATNRTSAVIVEKVAGKNLEDAQKENLVGIKHVVWCSKRAIPTDKPLEEVLKETMRFEIVMVPLEAKDPKSPWMQAIPKIVEPVRRITKSSSYYKAHAGVYVALNQVYFVRVVDRRSDGKLIITNPREPGQKKTVKEIEAVVEPDLVYPLVRGRDVKKWYVNLENRFIVLPHVPKTAKPIPENEIKVKLPLSYQYLNTYKNELAKRSIHELWGKDNPFYAVYDIGPYTFAPYKVVWGEISGAISGKAVNFECAVLEPIDGRPIIPDHKAMLVATSSPDEAYYVAGVLNSLIARCVIASYTYELGQETHIADVIKIPKFDPSSELHRRISGLSRRAHQLAKCIHSSIKPDYCRGVDARQELVKVEKELDLAVAELFGISREELREFERLFAILSCGEIPAEEEIRIAEEPKITVLNTLLPPNEESCIEVEVVNPSGEEVEVHYELPWNKGSFRVTEGGHRIPIPPLSPGKYEGSLRYIWRNSERGLKITIEVSEVTGPRRRRTLKLE